jgi:hypothetical protein
MKKVVFYLMNAFVTKPFSTLLKNYDKGLRRICCCYFVGFIFNRLIKRRNAAINKPQYFGVEISLFHVNFIISINLDIIVLISFIINLYRDKTMKFSINECK